MSLYFIQHDHQISMAPDPGTGRIRVRPGAEKAAQASLEAIPVEDRWQYDLVADGEGFATLVRKPAGAARAQSESDAKAYWDSKRASRSSRTKRQRLARLVAIRSSYQAAAAATLLDYSDLIAEVNARIAEAQGA